MSEKNEKDIEGMSLDKEPGKKEEWTEKDIEGMGNLEDPEIEKKEKDPVDAMSLDDPKKEEKKEEKKKEEPEKKEAEKKRPDVLDIKARLEKIFPDADSIDLGEGFKITKKDGVYVVDEESFDQLEVAGLLRIEAYLKFKESEKPGESKAKDFKTRIEKLFPKEQYVYIADGSVLVKKDDGSYSLNAVAVADLDDAQKTELEDFLKLREEEGKK